MAGSERTNEADNAATTKASTTKASTTTASEAAAGAASAAASTGAREPSGTGSAQHSPGPVAAATPVEAATISCLTNAHYHSGREAFLDTTHRWFMFLVIALGAAALTDALPRLLYSALGVSIDGAAIKEICAASAAIIAALDLTFDLSNRARAHSMMKP